MVLHPHHIHITPILPHKSPTQNGLAAETNAVLKACLRQPRINHIPPGDRFWTAHTLTHQLSSSGYFDKQPTWPHNYQVLCEDIDGNGAALYALGGAVAYLRDCLLDERIVPLGFLEALPGCEGVDGGLVGGERMQAVQQLAQHVTLDGAALENLEVGVLGVGGRGGGDGGGNEGGDEGGNEGVMIIMIMVIIIAENHHYHHYYHHHYHTL